MRAGERIAELRRGAGITQEQLAERLYVSRELVAKWENNSRRPGRSHIDSMAEELKKGGSIGRKLDFIAQEMNRESNTILSKSDDMAVSDRAIELKTTVEKVREQIQNIE